MADYDFGNLNDKDFESLSIDVLSSHFDLHIERFKAGRDGGVDGRFFSSLGGEVIIQCKHWIKTGLAALLRDIKAKEADKVKKLAPKRYIFVTSLGLSRANKTEITNIFSPYILSESDVFGNEDLNDLLSLNKEIEQKHYKLWISSTNVMRLIWNYAIIGRSKYKLEEIVEESSRYVMTKNHTQAMEKLEKIHSIIITGSPGVGKTSLADQLCLYYTAKEFELCYIENSLNEAENHYDEQLKQIFYFDDFLGRNFLRALDNHQDSQIVNFMRRVEKNDKKRFILTSRTNVLNRGKFLSDLFDIKNIQRNEYEVSVDSLGNYDKARILYNHIWHGQLEDDFIDEIYKDKRYHEIIKHKNYNPRLISFITDFHRLTSLNIDPGKYWGYTEEALSNPQDIWKNVFEVQIDEICRHVVVAISIHGKSITEKELKEFYVRLSSSNLRPRIHKSFDSAVRVLVGALLNRNVYSGRNCVEFDLFNPSIADYIISYYFEDFNYIDELLSCLKTAQSINNLHSLYKSDVIDKAFYSRALESQLNKLSKDDVNYSLDRYKLNLLLLLSEMMVPNGNLLKYVSDLADDALNRGWRALGSEYFEFINWSLELKIIDQYDSRLCSLLKLWALDEDKDHSEYVSLSKIISFVEPVPTKLTEVFKKRLVEYLSDEITGYVVEAGVLADVYDYESITDDDIIEYVSDVVLDFDIKFDKAEIEEISINCNIDDIIESNMSAAMQGDDDFEGWRDEGCCGLHGDDTLIDDLFDRS